MEDDQVRKRFYARATANRHVATLLVPHMKRLETWNSRAAHLSASLLANHMAPTEREKAESDLAALRAEVEGAFHAFRSDAGSLRHSRIEDVTRAYERLLTAIQQDRG